MAKMTMVQALNLAFRQEMQKDDRVIILGEDVGRDGGGFRVTEGLIVSSREGSGHPLAVGHCRHVDRHGDLWAQTRLRDPVFRVQLFLHASS
jgi:hypothetical protein